MKNALTAEALAKGFYLKEPDDHVVELWQGKQKLATFSQRGTIIEAIRHEVENLADENLAERKN